jgi:hypothetical protein
MTTQLNNPTSEPLSLVSDLVFYYGADYYYPYSCYQSSLYTIYVDAYALLAARKHPTCRPIFNTGEAEKVAY